MKIQLNKHIFINGMATVFGIGVGCFISFIPASILFQFPYSYCVAYIPWLMLLGASFFTLKTLLNTTNPTQLS